ncbi:unnamed protein product [Ranitomeya imitator]|uniref:Eukaryotic translation initiation factor 3 subunit E n=1 Tax=Ranitomeya imitator TaxID=111125 RepID=A0ABN9MLD1_9NEOB|nr:unnamed protein product [Ranitomeya imitator]
MMSSDLSTLSLRKQEEKKEDMADRHSGILDSRAVTSGPERDGRMLFDHLADKHGFRQEYLDTLYRYAKFQYECGNYSGAAEYLYFFRVLMELCLHQEFNIYLYPFIPLPLLCGRLTESNIGRSTSPHREHVCRVPSTDRNALSSLWGKLASEILMQNWDAAMEDLTRLKETIDNNVRGFIKCLASGTTKICFYVEILAALSHTEANHEFRLRTTQVPSPERHAGLVRHPSVLHSSLSSTGPGSSTGLSLVFFNHPKGRDNIIDLFLYQPQYLNAIQTMCPHILRYLTTAVITNKDVRKRRQVLKDLVKVIQQESYTYKDPITEFVECLYVNFDFDGAQKKLRECESVLVNDFFLVACLEDFIENARLFIFETFCRIHQCISISMLADKLNMSPEEAERWIVNLIRNARLDAKIDSKLGHVVMGNNAVSPYQQVIEKTKSLAFRSQMLAMNIEKKMNQNTRTEAPNWAAQDSGFY